MEVELLSSMGDDLSVVNAARVSFGKMHDKLTPGDENLIKYLAEHNHWTPFAHNSLTFRIKAPIFVARQLVKHTVGLVWNEISRRYVDTDVEVYFPDTWRARGGTSKQGSSQTEVIQFFEDEELGLKVPVDRLAKDSAKMSLDIYKMLLEAGVAPEQARMVLPLNMYTEWWWTGSLYAFARVAGLRCKDDTQKETRDVANRISEECQKIFPISWKYLQPSK